MEKNAYIVMLCLQVYSVICKHLLKSHLKCKFWKTVPKIKLQESVKEMKLQIINFKFVLGFLSYSFVIIMINLYTHWK